jgi:hypothetical protein
MKKSYLFITAALLFAGNLNAQRYVKEVFTDADIEVTSGVTYATNIDFLTSKFTNQAKVVADLTVIKTAVAMQQAIPALYYNPVDTNSVVKVTDIKMDIYKPKTSVDNLTNRPLVIYLHTGNFLPPGINGSPTGFRSDSSGVEACKKLAKRGYVVISADYRLGWNPIATTVQERRGTLLNAVYRAIHDVKKCVQFVRANAAGANTYGIDPTKIVLLGEGTGGYISNAYNTLNKYSEMALPKFINPLTSKSYIDTTTVGRIDGSGGLLNLYGSSAISSSISAAVNFGGALADTAWLEAGDAPMIAFQCVRDPFAPFGEGTVIVPTTMEDVVDVQGGNVFIKKANDLGNNTAFRSAEHNDAYSLAARNHYGKTYDYILPSPNDKITVTNSENLFPILLPLAASRMSNQSGPWQWWDPTSPAATRIVAAPNITAHMASMASNPDMSAAKGRSYVDTIIGYMTPRIATLFGYYNPASVRENAISSAISVYPNPAAENATISILNNVITEVKILDMNGRVVLSEINHNHSTVTLSIAALHKGMYLVQVTTPEGTGIQKLMVQ